MAEQEPDNRNSLFRKKQQLTNRRCPLLNEDENDEVFAALGPLSISVATSVARALVKVNGEYKNFENNCGVLCLVRDAIVRTYFLSLYSPQRGEFIGRIETPPGFKFKRTKIEFESISFESDGKWLCFMFDTDIEARLDAKLFIRILRRYTKLSVGRRIKRLFSHPVKTKTDSYKKLGSDDYISSSADYVTDPVLLMLFGQITGGCSDLMKDVRNRDIINQAIEENGGIERFRKLAEQMKNSPNSQQLSPLRRRACGPLVVSSVVSEMSSTGSPIGGTPPSPIPRLTVPTGIKSPTASFDAPLATSTPVPPPFAKGPLPSPIPHVSSPTTVTVPTASSDASDGGLQKANPSAQRRPSDLTGLGKEPPAKSPTTRRQSDLTGLDKQPSKNTGTTRRPSDLAGLNKQSGKKSTSADVSVSKSPRAAESTSPETSPPPPVKRIGPPLEPAKVPGTSASSQSPTTSPQHQQERDCATKSSTTEDDNDSDDDEDVESADNELLPSMIPPSPTGPLAEMRAGMSANRARRKDGFDPDNEPLERFIDVVERVRLAEAKRQDKEKAGNEKNKESTEDEWD